MDIPESNERGRIEKKEEKERWLECGLEQERERESKREKDSSKRKA